MEIQKIVWLDLSDSQKAEVLKRARTYLKEQKAEAKITKQGRVLLVKQFDKQRKLSSQKELSEKTATKMTAKSKEEKN